MKNLIFILLFLCCACSKPDPKEYVTPDCVQQEINRQYIIDAGFGLKVQLYEYQAKDYYFMQYTTLSNGIKVGYLLDNQCDTVCVRSHLDCDSNCGGFENFFIDAKTLKVLYQ